MNTLPLPQVLIIAQVLPYTGGQAQVGSIQIRKDSDAELGWQHFKVDEALFVFAPADTQQVTDVSARYLALGCAALLQQQRICQCGPCPSASLSVPLEVTLFTVLLLQLLVPHHPPQSLTHLQICRNTDSIYMFNREKSLICYSVSV